MSLKRFHRVDKNEELMNFPSGDKILIILGTLVPVAFLLIVAAYVVNKNSASDDLPELGSLTADEIAAEPPLSEFDDTMDEPLLPPISAEAAKVVEIEPMAEGGFINAKGNYVVDVLEQDYAYLGIRLTTPEGQPVEGASATFSISGTSKLVPPEEVSPDPTSNENGMIEFAVVGGKMGLDTITVNYGKTRTEILINVISPSAAGIPDLPEVKGALTWAELMQTKLRYEGKDLVANFPTAIRQRAGKTVKITGFMMPLESDLHQRRFLLTSNPPSCFFHIPGGPAGAVEVFAPEGVEMSWDPLVLEGRFEPQANNETGVIYQLYDARLIDP